MLAATVDLELLDHGSSHSCLGKHASNSGFNDAFRMLFKLFAKASLLEATGVTGVPHDHSLLGLSAGHDNTFGIRDNHEVAGVDMRGVLGAMLAHEYGRDLDGHSAEYLAIGIDVSPAFCDVAILGKGGLTRHGTYDLCGRPCITGARQGTW